MLLNIDKCFRFAYLVKTTAQRIASSATSVSASAVFYFWACFGFFAALFTREFDIVYEKVLLLLFPWLRHLDEFRETARCVARIWNMKIYCVYVAWAGEMWTVWLRVCVCVCVVCVFCICVYICVSVCLLFFWAVFSCSRKSWLGFGLWFVTDSKGRAGTGGGNVEVERKRVWERWRWRACQQVPVPKIWCLYLYKCWFMRFPFMLRIYLCLRLQPNYELETN